MPSYEITSPYTYVYDKWTCDGVVTRNWSTTGVGRRFRSDSNATQRRQFPASPMDAMTDLALQNNSSSRKATGKWMATYPLSCRLGNSGGYYSTLRKYVEKSMCNYILPATPPDPDWATQMRMALKNLKVNLGQDLAEYRQSANMFRDGALGVVNAWKTYKGRRPRRKLTPCMVPATDLIYSFGVAPLLDTVYDSVEKLRSTLDQPTHVKLVQSASKTSKISMDYTSEVKVKGVNTRTSRAEAHIWFNRGSSQFTVGNPAEIAWELVPYSFVFDYMIPIGTMLSALDALTGVIKLRGTVTHKDRQSCAYWYKSTAMPSPYVWTGGSTGKSEYHGHSRKVISTIPMPAFPHWEPSASWHKLRHAVELLYMHRKC